MVATVIADQEHVVVDEGRDKRDGTGDGKVRRAADEARDGLRRAGGHHAVGPVHELLARLRNRRGNLGAGESCAPVDVDDRRTRQRAADPSLEGHGLGSSDPLRVEYHGLPVGRERAHDLGVGVTVTRPVRLRVPPGELVARKAIGVGGDCLGDAVHHGLVGHAARRAGSARPERDGVVEGIPAGIERYRRPLRGRQIGGEQLDVGE